MQAHNVLTSEQVKKVVNNKNSMYDAVVRNGYLVSERKDELNSFEFLDQVRTGNAWLPQTKECKMYSCLQPPNRPVLAQLVVAGIYEMLRTEQYSGQQQRAMSNTAERITKYPPNKNFLLLLLYNMCPGHEIFQKDYVRPKPAKQVAAQHKVDNSNGFFSGLPECKTTKKSKAVGVNKAERDAAKLDAMQKAAQHLKNRIAQSAASMQQPLGQQQPPVNVMMNQPAQSGIFVQQQPIHAVNPVRNVLDNSNGDQQQVNQVENEAQHQQVVDDGSVAQQIQQPNVIGNADEQALEEVENVDMPPMNEADVVFHQQQTRRQMRKAIADSKSTGKVSKSMRKLSQEHEDHSRMEVDSKHK